MFIFLLKAYSKPVDRWPQSSDSRTQAPSITWLHHLQPQFPQVIMFVSSQKDHGARPRGMNIPSKTFHQTDLDHGDTLICRGQGAAKCDLFLDSEEREVKT